MIVLLLSVVALLWFGLSKPGWSKAPPDPRRNWNYGGSCHHNVQSVRRGDPDFMHCEDCDKRLCSRCGIRPVSPDYTMCDWCGI
jgi:hypothetical protein